MCITPSLPPLPEPIAYQIPWTPSPNNHISTTPPPRCIIIRKTNITAIWPKPRQYVNRNHRIDLSSQSINAIMQCPIPTLHPASYDLMYVSYEFLPNQVLYELLRIQVFFFHLQAALSHHPQVVHLRVLR